MARQNCERRRKPARVPPWRIVDCLPAGILTVLLPPLLQPFLARYPQVNIQIVPQESPLLEEWLSAQRHDLGLTETLHTPAGTKRTELLALDEVCVLPQGIR